MKHENRITNNVKSYAKTQLFVEFYSRNEINNDVILQTEQHRKNWFALFMLQVGEGTGINYCIRFKWSEKSQYTMRR